MKESKTKIELVRKFVKEGDHALKSNKEIAELIVKETGVYVAESTVIDAIGKQKTRRDAYCEEAFAAISNLFDVCRHDVKFVKFCVDGYIREWHRIRKNPDIKFTNIT